MSMPLSNRVHLYSFLIFGQEEVNHHFLPEISCLILVAESQTTKHMSMIKQAGNQSGDKRD